MLDYQIPSELKTAEVEIKRSRFLAFAKHTEGSVEAKAFIQQLKNEYPDARHHCHAFIAGSPIDSKLYGFSDDGEPSGTAGMPIFTHLKYSDLGEITLVVVRYFGGTKLGTGGLAKAYGDAAREVLLGIKTNKHISTEEQVLELSFAQEAQVRKLIEEVKGKVINVEYNQTVKLTAQIPISQEFELPYSVQRLPKSTI